MTNQDQKVKIADNIMVTIFMIVAAYGAYLWHDYSCKKLKNPPIEYKIIQVPHVDLFDTIHISSDFGIKTRDSFKLNTQH